VKTEILEIPLEKLVIADYNPRIGHTNDFLRELRKSMENSGQLDYLDVRPDGDKYEVFNGGARLEILQQQGVKKALCRVHYISREEAMKIALTKALIHEDLTNEEIGLFIRRLLKEGIFRTQKEVAIYLGKSEQWVSNVLNSINEVKTEVAVRELKTEENLDLKTARMLLELPDSKRKQVLETIEYFPVESRREFVKRVVEEPDKPLDEVVRTFSGSAKSKKITLNLTVRYEIIVEDEEVIIQKERNRFSIPRKDLQGLLEALRKLI